MQAWDDFLLKQEPLLGKDVVEKWLRTMKVVHFDSGNLYLEAKDSFQVLWFEEHLRPTLKSKLLNNNFRPVKVHISVGELKTPPAQAPAKSKTGKSPSPQAVHYFLDKIDPSLTLENFVPGETNKILFKLLSELTGYDPQTEKYTAPSVALGAFNPIYLWGGSGSGKTHLLMALAQAFKGRGLNPLYARAETFTEHVVAAIRGSEMQVFRKAYRHADILLIDDVHVFSRKDATQEEFFHTFNTLHTSGRQVILSANCTPALLKEIEPRLVSRFEWGINIHLEKLSGPDLKQVLQKRCEGFQFPLTDEVLDYLITTFPSARSLHRALEALILRSHLNARSSAATLDPASVQRILADLEEEEKKTALSPDKIIASVASIYGIRQEDLLGKSQSQDCSLPRQIAMYLCRHELRLPFQGIGSIFSRDHSTVMTGIKQIEKRLEASDRELHSSLLEIRQIL